MSGSSSTTMKNADLRPPLPSGFPSTWRWRRAKHLFKEIVDLSEDGSETLLSVSEYFGVAPRHSIREENEHLTRAESLEGYKRCQPGDLVMNIMLAWKTGLGVSPCKGIVSPAYGVFRLVDPAHCPRFFHYLLRSAPYVRLFGQHSYGVIESRWRLYPEKFLGLFITEPPAEEQWSITAFLDRETERIDGLIAKKQRLIELLLAQHAESLASLTSGVAFTGEKKLATGTIWIPRVPDRWTVSRLKFLCSHVVDCPHSTPDYDDDGEYPVIRTADLVPGHLDWQNARRGNAETYRERIQRLRPIAGDILYSREGERYGIAAGVPDGVQLCLGQRMMHFRARQDVCARFVMHQLNARHVLNQAAQDVAGATAPHVNVDTIRNYVLAVPPLADQRRIADRLDENLQMVSRTREAITRAISLLTEYRSALITAAVTGQLDLTKAAPPLPSEATA